jgi:hypothetical protein
MAALSDDGVTFSKPVKSPTLIMAGGKNWGQKTEDGRYAMVYNPIEIDEYRYPLSVITSDDGIIFDNMLLVQGEVPPRRFYGRWKDFGPCYVRGIVEGNGDPPGNDMWLTYSMNKEDIWVSRVPTPIVYTVQGEINDDFQDMEVGGAIASWNTYSPQWAPIDLIADQDANQCIQLKDKDPYDYARALRVFEESNKCEIEFRIKAQQLSKQPFEIDLVDRFGNRPVRISLNSNGEITANNGFKRTAIASFETGSWINFKIEVDASPFGSYSVWIEGNKVASEFELAEAIKSVERVSFRTGPYRDIPNRKTPNETPAPPLPGADDPVEEAIFLLDDFSARRVK